MKRHYTSICYLVFTAGLVWSVYLMTFEENVWAMNLVRFYVGFVVFIGLVLLHSAALDALAGDLKADRNWIPRWLTNWTDLACIIMLAAFGHFWLAAGWVFGWFSAERVRDRRKELKEKTEQNRRTEQREHYERFSRS